MRSFPTEGADLATGWWSNGMGSQSPVFSCFQGGWEGRESSISNRGSVEEGCSRVGNAASPVLHSCFGKVMGKFLFSLISMHIGEPGLFRFQHTLPSC